MRCLCLKGGGVMVMKGGIVQWGQRTCLLNKLLPKLSSAYETESHRNTSMFKDFKSHSIALYSRS